MFLRLQKNPSLKIVVGAAIAFFVLSLILTLHRYFTFYASYDQGIFNQVFWNGIHGRFFQSSLSSTLSTNVVHSGEIPEVFYHRLGQHFTPALLLWLPIYALYPSPATLHVIQVTLVTAAGLVLYLLARQYLEPPLSAAIAVSFYAANAVIGPTLSNFHDLCQIPLYIFTLLLAMEKRWWWLFWLMAGLVLVVREDTGVGLFGVGMYMILSKRYPRMGLAVCTLSFAYIVLVTNFLMLLFSEDMARRFPLERFGQFAPEDSEAVSTLGILWGMISNPVRLIGALFTPFGRKIRYLLGQWLPLAFVPAVAPASWTIAGFPLLKIFLQRGTSSLAINIRYAMTVVPGLFYGAILWWSAHPDLYKKSSFRRFWAICIGLSIFFTFTSNPNRTFYFLIPDSIEPKVYVSLPRQWEHSRAIRSFLTQIPKDASVAATTYIVPHLSSRREIIRFPSVQVRNDAREVIEVEYAIADLWQLQQYQAAFNNDRDRLREIVPVIEQIVGNRQYGVIGFQDGIIFMQRGASSDPAAISQWQAFRQEIDPILQEAN